MYIYTEYRTQYGMPNTGTDDLRITDLNLSDHARCMRESAESRSAAVRAVLLRFYPHQYAWGDSCAVTVSLQLGFREAAHDGRVMNPISNPTIVCRLPECPARARC